MAVAGAVGGPPGRTVEGTDAAARIGGGRSGLHVVAVGGGGGGRLLYRGARGAAAVGDLQVCPPERHVPLRTTAIDAGVPADRRAVPIAPFADTTTKPPSAREVRVEVPWTGDARSAAIPVSSDARVREARQVFVLACGPAGRAVLVVAEAAETTGFDVFEAVSKRTGR